MDIDKAKIKLKNGKNMTIGYGMIDKNNYDVNHPFNIRRVLELTFIKILPEQSYGCLKNNR